MSQAEEKKPATGVTEDRHCRDARAIITAEDETTATESENALTENDVTTSGESEDSTNDTSAEPQPCKNTPDVTCILSNSDKKAVVTTASLRAKAEQQLASVKAGPKEKIWFNNQTAAEAKLTLWN
jgi:hypothetical protein